MDMDAATRNAWIVQIIGVVMLIIGGVLLIGGTTSIALFLFYGVIAIAGVVVAILGQRMLKRASGR